MNEYQREKASYIKRHGVKAWKQYLKAKRIRKENKNPIRCMLIESRRSAKRRGIPFHLPIYNTTLTIPDTCPVLGIPLYKVRGIMGGGPNSPTIDRIDNTKGYIEGNVRIISKRANSLKSNGTLEELERIVKYIKDNTQ